MTATTSQKISSEEQDSRQETGATCTTNARWAFCQNTRSWWTAGLGLMAVVIAIAVLF